jgi:hypothetical protein
VLLQAPLIGQQFTRADPSGDRGAYDCLPASLTMAMSILVQRPADYSSVRQYMRAKSGVKVGGLGQTYGVVEYSTAGRFSADQTYHQVAADGWRALLGGELAQGRPLVLYIADASLLDDSSGQARRPANESFPDAHAVLAVGLLDGGATVVVDDPWNATQDAPGRQLRMTADAFAAAWGNTRFSGGTVYSNAGWNYIGFRSTSTTGVTPEVTPTPAITMQSPTPAPKLLVPDAPSGAIEWATAGGADGLGVANFKWVPPTEPVTGYYILAFGGILIGETFSPPTCGSGGGWTKLDASATTYSTDAGSRMPDAWICAFNSAGSSRVVEFQVQP